MWHPHETWLNVAPEYYQLHIKWWWPSQAPYSTPWYKRKHLLTLGYRKVLELFHRPIYIYFDMFLSIFILLNGDSLVSQSSETQRKPSIMVKVSFQIRYASLLSIIDWVSLDFNPWGSSHSMTYHLKTV